MDSDSSGVRTPPSAPPGLHTLVSPWRLGNRDVEAAVLPPADPAPASTPEVPPHPDDAARQVAPHIAAALLAKPRAELTVRQAEVVDALKVGCPGYARMRSLMLAFRSILRAPAHPAAAGTPVRSTAALHRWLNRAQASGIDLIQAFVGQLRRDVRAVEAAVTTPWSNGQVEGQVNRLKTLKRQTYGRASVELLRARLMPLPEVPPALQRE